MLTDVKQKINFVDIAGNTLYDVTDSLVVMAPGLDKMRMERRQRRGIRVGESSSW